MGSQYFLSIVLCDFVTADHEPQTVLIGPPFAETNAEEEDTV
jgi:hypothetical protein